jgi:hypothetical protein
MGPSPGIVPHQPAAHLMALGAALSLWVLTLMLRAICPDCFVFILNITLVTGFIAIFIVLLSIVCHFISFQFIF